jgi:hypothetical protein
MSDALFDVVTVHCFFGRWCNHKVQNVDPVAASRTMEQHYEAVHYDKHLQIVYRDMERKP